MDIIKIAIIFLSPLIKNIIPKTISTTPVNFTRKGLYGKYGGMIAL